MGSANDVILNSGVICDDNSSFDCAGQGSAARHDLILYMALLRLVIRSLMVAELVINSPIVNQRP